MNISEIFIRRPIMTTLVMAAILIFGIVAYRSLPVSDLPNVDFPTILVSAKLPGASPETMASAVATPLEKQFSTIAGLDTMTSTNALGVSQITLQFKLDRNIDAAAQDVQSAMAVAAGQLPPSMPTPPTYRKVNPADSPVFYLTLRSPTLPLWELNEYAETMLAQQISMIEGVAQVQVYGSQKYAVRIQLDPKALASRSIGIDEVVDAVQKGNVNLPTGTLWGKDKAVTLQATGQLMNAAAYRPLIVRYQNGQPVRLSELGRVIDSVENDKISSWYEDERAIILAIQKQPGTNTVAVVDSIKALLPKFRAEMPASVRLDIRYDRSETIRASVRDVQITLLVALALVILVIFIFLRNLSATVIPSLALPFSIVGTFAAMYFAGFSLDNLSLMALTLAIGFVVDDAIVMLENIVRHMEKGEKPLQAALNGSREIGFTIVSMTVSLVAVFIPVLFMGGIVGRLLHEFAVTISVAVLISGVVSISLTPMLCALFLRPKKRERHGPLFSAFERFFNGMLSLYERSLRWAIRRRRATLIVSLVFLVLVIYLFVVVPKGFMPSDDTDQLICFTEAKQGVSYEAMIDIQKKVGAIIAENPNVYKVAINVGVSGSSTTLNTGRMFVRLKPRSQRKADADEVIQQLRPKLAGLPEVKAFLQNPPPIRIGGVLTKSQYQYTVQSTDTGELYKYAPMLEEKIRTIPGVLDVTSDLQAKNPQVTVNIDRDKASALGLSAGQIEEALYSCYSARQVSTIYAATNQYQVIVELEPRYQADPAALSMVYVRSSRGSLVPLSTVARMEEHAGPLTINHLGQLPAINISFNLAPGMALGDAVSGVEKAAREILPPSITGSVQGAAQAFKSSMVGLGVLILVAIFVIYIVLGILYESFIHPITILSGLPSAGLGALLALMLFGIDLNLYALVGVIMLVGIVKKNAIMMIDFALDAERKEGKTPGEAIYQGAVVRFRPIMMTTMSALMATVPIAAGLGAGAESRQPLGIAVVGGLIFSQIITLYITPVIYTYLDEFQKFVKTRFGRKADEENGGAEEKAAG